MGLRDVMREHGFCVSYRTVTGSVYSHPVISRCANGEAVEHVDDLVGAWCWLVTHRFLTVDELARHVYGWATPADPAQEPWMVHDADALAAWLLCVGGYGRDRVVVDRGHNIEVVARAAEDVDGIKALLRRLPVKVRASKHAAVVMTVIPRASALPPRPATVAVAS